MGFTQAVGSCFRKYVVFSGRARRAEFWWFALFSAVGSILLGILDVMAFGGNMNDPSPLSSLFSLALLLPSISVAVRRLHDLGRSGWWYWLLFIPFVGWVILVVWYAGKGTAGPNRYGPDPLPDQGAGGQGGGPDQESYRRSAIPAVKRG